MSEQVPDYPWPLPFKAMRHDKSHHLGLGDIWLTVAQQDEIEAYVNMLEARVEELEKALSPFVVYCDCGAEHHIDKRTEC